jgi:hypothetical protein
LHGSVKPKRRPVGRQSEPGGSPGAAAAGHGYKEMCRVIAPSPATGILAHKQKQFREMLESLGEGPLLLLYHSLCRFEVLARNPNAMQSAAISIAARFFQRPPPAIAKAVPKPLLDDLLALVDALWPRSPAVSQSTTPSASPVASPRGSISELSDSVFDIAHIEPEFVFDKVKSCVLMRLREHWDRYRPSTASPVSSPTPGSLRSRMKNLMGKLSRDPSPERSRPCVINLNDSSPRECRDRLQTVIYDYRCGPFFREYCESTFCVENLDFFLQCNDYLTFTGDTDAVRRQEAHIYVTFLDPNAVSAVNISGRTRTIVDRLLAESRAAETPDRLAFYPAQQEILDLMASDTLAGFARSSNFSEYWNDGKGPTTDPALQERTNRRRSWFGPFGRNL